MSEELKYLTDEDQALYRRMLTADLHGYPHVLRLLRSLNAARKELAKLQGELASIDDRLARRPAISDLPTRAEKIERMCAVAGRAEKAEAELAELKSAEQWIPVSEQEPELNQWVATFCTKGHVAARMWNDWVPDYLYCGAKITHWRPLPVPPEQKEKICTCTALSQMYCEVHGVGEP